MAIHIFFTDGTSYEIYSGMFAMSFAGGLNHWSMEEAREYMGPPLENILDVAVDDEPH